MKPNPNETRGTSDKEAVDTCAECGMEKGDWTANGGKGFRQDDGVYCCAGCADGSGCTCESDESEVQQGAQLERKD